MMKILNHHGRSIKMGRNRPSPETLARPRLHLGKYIDDKALPTMPLTTGARFQKTLNAVNQMYGNDTYGDCTMVGRAHLTGFFTGLANPPATIYQAQQVISDYLRLTGGQDNGLDEITVLEDWRDNKSSPLGPQHNISAFASVNVANENHVKFAIDAFPNGYLGIELPDAYVNPFPAASGFTWAPEGDPDPSNGHCVVTSDYDQEGIIIWTWAMWGHMTWKAVAKYLTPAAGGGFYVVMSQDAINKAQQKTPSGFDWAQLQTDMGQIGQVQQAGA